MLALDQLRPPGGMRRRASPRQPAAVLRQRPLSPRGPGTVKGRPPSSSPRAQPPASMECWDALSTSPESSWDSGAGDAAPWSPRPCEPPAPWDEDDGAGVASDLSASSDPISIPPRPHRVTAAPAPPGSLARERRAASLAAVERCWIEMAAGAQAQRRQRSDSLESRPPLDQRAPTLGSDEEDTVLSLHDDVPNLDVARHLRDPTYLAAEFRRRRRVERDDQRSQQAAAAGAEPASAPGPPRSRGAAALWARARAYRSRRASAS